MNAETQIDTSQAVALPMPTNPMAVIDRAIATGATPETLGKLLDLQERWEAGQAKKAFIAAMAVARMKFAPIIKRKSGYASRYKYETLPEVIEAVDGALSENGFSYDWETEDLPDGKIRVTCVITHEAGHSKRNSLSGDPRDTADAKANMNGFQRMGGAVTYLQRYTLKAALGIAADDDSDANAPPDSGGLITADQHQEIQSLIEETKAEEAKVLAKVNGREFEKLTFKQASEAIAALKNYKKKLAENKGGANAAAK